MTITRGKVRFTPSEMEMLKEENIDLESHGFVKTNKNKCHEYYVPTKKEKNDMTIKKDTVKFTPTETKKVLKMRDSVDYIMSIAERFNAIHEDKIVEVTPQSELHVINGYKVRMAK